MLLNTIKKNWPIVVILFLVAVFFGKALLPPRGYILYGGDLNDQFYFWKGFLADNIRQGIIPYWNPYSFSGTPFLAHPSVAVFYPLTLIFVLFPLNIAFSIYLYFHLVFAGVFMYILSRKYTDKISALAGGIVFSLSGLMAARIYSGHIDIISTMIWIPAVFWSISNALESKKRRDICLAILFLSLQILAGYQAVVIFTLELIFIFQLAISIFDYIHKKKLKDIIWNFLVIIFVTLISYGISAIQILPTLEFVRNSIRGRGLPYDLLTWGSYTRDMFSMFIQPFKYGNPFPDNYTYNGPGPNFFEISYFMGILPLLMSLIFALYQILLFLQKRKINKVFIGLLVGVSFFLFAAMGNNFLLHKLLFQIFPVYRLFRFPSQHLILVVFIISFTVGLSLNILKNRIIKLVILLLIIVELLSYDKQFIHLQKIPVNTYDHNLTSILQNNDELTRVLPDYSVVSKVRQSWDFESSIHYQIQSTSGYNPILLSNYYQFIDLINNNNSSSIVYYNVEIPPPDPFSKDIDSLNVKYVLADKNDDKIKNNPLGKYRLKKEGESYRLYENRDYLPRFFVNCSDNAIRKVDIINYKLNSISIKTNSDCDGILSSSEVNYPGWKAKVDGSEVQITLIKNIFRSVNLTKGIHKIEFYYQPLIYYIGGFISLGSLILTVIIFRKSR